VNVEKLGLKSENRDVSGASSTGGPGKLAAKSRDNDTPVFMKELKKRGVRRNKLLSRRELRLKE